MQQLRSLIQGLGAGLIIFLADPLIGIWPAVLLSYGFVIYFLMLNLNSSLKFETKFYFLRTFLFLFGFSFCYKLILTRPLFVILKLHFSSFWLGSFYTLLFSAVLATAFSLALALCYTLLKKIGLKNIYIQIVLIPAPFAGFDFLNRVYLNLSPAVLLGQQNQILSAFGLVNQDILVYFLILLCALFVFGFVSNYKIQKISFMSLTILMIICVFFVGAYRKNILESRILSWNSVSLIQTGQSLYQRPYSEVLWKEITSDLNSQNLKSADRGLVVWPETLFLENEYNNKEFLQTVQNIKYQADHFLGLLKIEDNLFHNTAVHVGPSGQKINSYQKNILFPVGESDIDIPILGLNILKNKIQYSKSSEKTAFLYNDVTFIPLLCSETNQINYAKNFIQTFANPESKYDPIIISISKDSYSENTSALRYLSLLAQWTASYSNAVMIRSTNIKYSAVISPWGEILSQSQKTGYDVVNTVYPVLKNTHSH